MMKKRKKGFDLRSCLVWVLTMVFSITLILVGHQIATKDFTIFSATGNDVVQGTVIQVLDRSSDETSLGDASNYTSTYINFTCRMESGDRQGETITAQQTIDTLYGGNEYIKEVEAGDKIMLVHAEGTEGDATDTATDGSQVTTDSGGGSQATTDTGGGSQATADTGDGSQVTADATAEPLAWQFSDYYRMDKILILGLVFLGLVLLIGRWKGVNTLLSLVFTFSFVFFVFVPAIMNGYNVYAGAAITCIFTIIMTLLLINGSSRKTWATVSGCVAGTLIAAGTTFAMSKILNLTGFTDEHSLYLSMMNPDSPIDLKAIIFAAIIIGALGAIMDVAMDLSSSLHELSTQVSDLTFSGLCKSGMSIGRDIMGTMANTLVLAYIGSSLCSIMLLLTYSMSAQQLLNREVIIVDFLQALIGSLAILLTIPCTVVICGILYLRKRPRAKQEETPLQERSSLQKEVHQQQEETLQEKVPVSRNRRSRRRKKEDDIPDWADSWELENRSEDDRKF